MLVSLSVFDRAAQDTSIHGSFSCKGARGEAQDKICSVQFAHSHLWIHRLSREYNSFLLRLEQQDSEVQIEALKVFATLRISATWLNLVIFSMVQPKVWLPSPPTLSLSHQALFLFWYNKSVYASLSHHSSSLYSFWLYMYQLLLSQYQEFK